LEKVGKYSEKRGKSETGRKCIIGLGGGWTPLILRTRTSMAQSRIFANVSPSNRNKLPCPLEQRFSTGGTHTPRGTSAVARGMQDKILYQNIFC